MSDSEELSEIESLDLSDETPQESPSQLSANASLDPHLILKFAKQILAGAAVVAVLCMLLALFGPGLLVSDCTPDDSKFQEYLLETGSAILTIVTTVIPPIVTLVLGFYFGKKTGDG